MQLLPESLRSRWPPTDVLFVCLSVWWINPRQVPVVSDGRTVRLSVCLSVWWINPRQGLPQGVDFLKIELGTLQFFMCCEVTFLKTVYLSDLFDTCISKEETRRGLIFIIIGTGGFRGGGRDVRPPPPKKTNKPQINTKNK